MFGGHSWDRTNDLPIKSRLLYQLSYVPEKQEKTRGPAEKPQPLGKIGEPRWGRTNDHLIKSQVLYRLS